MEKPLAHPPQQKSKPSSLQKQLPKTAEHQRSFVHVPSKPSNNVVSGKVSKNNNEYSHKTNVKKPLWDCGSTLYDSFELNALQKQLDSAIVSSRTMSMPRLPSEDVTRDTSPAPQKKSKLSRSFQKLLRTMFRAPKQETTKPNYDSNSSSSDDYNLNNYLWLLDQPTNDKKVADNGSRYYVVYEKSSNGLSTIPEVSEAAFSAEGGSLIRKTMSERFTSRSIGISCV